MSNFISLSDRRKQRNRSSLKKKSMGKLRLSVFRSGKHIYGQIIDDIKVGKLIAEKAIKQGVTNVVFDRGGYIYHGRVKSLAEAARESGLIF